VPGDVVTPTDTLGTRVDRLESTTADLGRQVERVASEQTHLDRLMTLRFGTVDSALAGIATRLDTMSTAITTAGGDAASTPSGRALVKDIAEGKAARGLIDVSIGDLADRLAVVERRMYMALGAVSLTVVLLGLFGPAIRAAIGLP
jgi:hypothetical protein